MVPVARANGGVARANGDVARANGGVDVSFKTKFIDDGKLCSVNGGVARANEYQKCGVARANDEVWRGRTTS